MRVVTRGIIQDHLPTIGRPGARILLCAVGIVLLQFAAGCTNFKTNLVQVNSRPGIQQGFIHIMPEEPPVASVILFAGGHGELRLNGAHSMVWGKANFLVRSREAFAFNGLQVAVIDTPKSTAGTFMTLRRSTAEHLNDVKAVAAYLRSQADVPVWLIGTSMGTDSVGYLAVQGDDFFDGVVFTASADKTAHYDLPKVTVPALVVHNKRDGCGGAYPPVAKLIHDRLENSPRRDLKYFSSWQTISTDECQALTPHGFLGIESEVVEYVANFIKGT